MPAKPLKSLRLGTTSHPILYEVNTRVLLNELSAKAGKNITLDKIPDTLLDEWADYRFDAIWLMGVWTTGELGVRIAREHQGLRSEYQKALPDFSDEDVFGSPYAVKSYTVARRLGGKKALEVLRRKLQQRGMGLFLDFVSNHTARDHVWVNETPEFYVNGTDGEENEKPEYFFRTETKKGSRTIAYGRDPYFPGWTDTAQLNVFHPGTRTAMIKTLASLAGMCDGVRCDMAMLILRQVFADTWGERARPQAQAVATTEFWEEAIASIRKEFPNFIFLAEAYWDLEWRLQQLGFDYTYDKTLYDRLLHEGASSVRDHLKAEMAFQQHCARFIENHDERRAAQALPSTAWQYAAAMIALSVPGMVLLHEGQLDGRSVKLPVQLGRRQPEECATGTRSFYKLLLTSLDCDCIKQGEWRLLNHHAAWSNNYSYQNIIAYAWRKGGEMRVIVVNYAPQNSQCYVELELEGIDGASLEFRDLLSPAVYVRDRAGLLNKGMYFDLPGYGMHLFEVRSVK
jgi:hypothetical protein